LFQRRELRLSFLPASPRSALVTIFPIVRPRNPPVPKARVFVKAIVQFHPFLAMCELFDGRSVNGISVGQEHRNVLVGRIEQGAAFERFKID
jgi:hypothetical protein